MRRAGVLEALVGLALVGCMVAAYLATRPQLAAVSSEEAAAAEEGSADDASSAATSKGTDAGSAEVKPEPEPEPEPLDPATLAAGDVVSNEDIERAGGVDAFFWAEEISDEVFARMEGKSFGPDCTVPRTDLRYVRVLHTDAEGVSKVGELVVNRRVADEIVDIFRQLYEERYPIRKMYLVDDYDADDGRSCSDDNTSAFNYRYIAGTTVISNHAYGLAIDINTFENPYVKPYEDYVYPPEARHYMDRSLREPYMTHPDDICYQLFTEHGWSWGGNWDTPKDYQHFEKPQALQEP